MLLKIHGIHFICLPQAHGKHQIITVTYTVEMGGGESGVLLFNEMKQTKT